VELKYRGVKVLRVESQPRRPHAPARSRQRVRRPVAPGGFFQTPTVFYILVMLATGLVLDSVMLRLRRRLIPWDDETA
jgi:hypothetical protein